jgi:hypothetical protein
VIGGVILEKTCNGKWIEWVFYSLIGISAGFLNEGKPFGSIGKSHIIRSPGKIINATIVIKVKTSITFFA